MMTAKRIGLFVGLAAFLVTLIVPTPAGMPPLAWPTAGLVVWMAAWWMTEAVPLPATAMLPFIVLPLLGVADAETTASSYYSQIMFLFVGGSFLALAIERTGLHRRLAIAIMSRASGSSWQLLFAVMAATAAISTVISNTATAFIMMPMALAMLAAGGVKDGETGGMAGALPMGVAFAATLGGFGTIVGTPTNAIAAALLERTLGVEISFVEWSLFGMPIVLLSVPLAAFIIGRVQRLSEDTFDPAAARLAIRQDKAWTVPEKRLATLFALTVLAWVSLPLLEQLVPEGGLRDGSIAAVAGLALFLIPDGTGRKLLVWSEANRAPWDIVFMFGGGLALAMGMSESGLAQWLGQMLLPLGGVPLIVIAVVVVAMVVVITEFASNIAAASAIMPVIAALVAALGADPILLALPAAFAASWGFMLPAGTGPNAIAWGTRHVALPSVLKSGFALDVAGIFIILGVVWGVAALA
jgi:sodium-dependent dicarboxylate transporter 2/3/5